MTQQATIVNVGDIIVVNNWGFRLEEFIEGPGGDVHVRFINANEMAKVDSEVKS